MKLHYVPHEICSQLSGISQWLDAHPQLNDWIYEDLSSGEKQNTSRNGLTTLYDYEYTVTTEPSKMRPENASTLVKKRRAATA